MAIVVKTNFTFRADVDAIRRTTRELALNRTVVIVKETVNEYLQEVRAHMGTISGETPHSENGIAWEELSHDALADGSTNFWLESGALKNSLIASVTVTAEGLIRVFAGVPRSSEHFDEALWNELGFHPHNSDKLLRRSLLLPLADEYIGKLQERLAGAMRVNFHFKLRA